MIVIKVLVQEFIVSLTSVYTPLGGLDDSRKDHFYDNLIAAAGKFREKKVIDIAQNFNSDVQVVQKVMRIGVNNKEGEKTLEFCAAMIMIVKNTLFNKDKSHLDP